MRYTFSRRALMSGLIALAITAGVTGERPVREGGLGPLLAAGVGIAGVRAKTIKKPDYTALNAERLVAAGELDWQDKVVYRRAIDDQGGLGALQFFAREGVDYSLRALADLASP